MAKEKRKSTRQNHVQAKAEMSEKRRRLLDELPKHGWDYVKAGLAAGYSQAYATAHLKEWATKSVEFCQMVLAKRQEIEAGTQDRREKRLHNLDDIIEDPHTNQRDRIKAIEVQGKMCGWLSETRVLEVSDRQRILSEAETTEARLLAKLRFKSLPGPDLQTGVLSNRTVGEIQDAELVETGPKATKNPPQTVENQPAPGDSAAVPGDPDVPPDAPAAPFPCSPQIPTENPNQDSQHPEKESSDG